MSNGPGQKNGEIAIRFEEVSKTFGSQKVLDHISFQVSAGEGFCLLGRSGIGKSVTLKIMIGLVKPEAGKVFISGTNIQSLAAPELSAVRKRMGFLFQNAALFDSISVAENVAFPLHRHTNKSEEEIRAIVHEKLKEVELENEGEKSPAQLSGGMSKRAALARALALDPPIILVDEPSSGLDVITASEIYDLLLRLRKKRKVTLIVVTHDVVGAQKFADQFAVLDGGAIACCGTADDLAHSENALVRELAKGSIT